MSLTTHLARARGGEPTPTEQRKGPAPARRIEEGDGIRAELAKTSNFGASACAAFVDKLGVLVKSEKDPVRARALLILDLVDEIRKLGYRDYRMTVGVINQCRDDSSGMALDRLIRSPADFAEASPALAKSCETISHLVHSLASERNAGLPVRRDGPPIDAKLYADCAEHVMLLLRSTYSLGVNIRNAGWEKSAGPTSYPADSMVGLWLGRDHAPRRESGAVIIKPSRSNTSVVKYVPFGKAWDDVIEGAVLQNGESVIIGRPLRLPSEFLGVSLGQQFEVTVGVKIPDASWSRGGLLVSRDKDGGNVFVFDRGMRQPLVRPDEIGGVESYIPRTIVSQGRDRAVSFGESVVFRAGSGRPPLQ